MLDSKVQTSNDEFVDNLFGDKTPGAENLLGGKKEEDPEKKEEGKKDEKKAVTPTEAQGLADKLNSNEYLDNLLGGEETKEEGASDEEPKKTTPKKEVPKKAEESPIEVDYEALYSKMVDDGVWKEVELGDDVTWDKDTFLQVQKLQASQEYEDLLSKTGNYGKAIIKYEQDGGNPGELLNLFREQREVQQYDIKDAEGQEEFLRAYLESQGNSEKSIERSINSLKDAGEEALKEEADEKKSIWDKQYQEEIQVKQNEQALYAKEMQEAQTKFQTNIKDTVVKDADLTPKERKDLQSYILSYNQNMNGYEVSQFYVDMTEIQKDPKNYIELAKFIKGLKNGDYRKKIVEKTAKEVKAETFIKIKNGASLKINGGTNNDVSEASKTPGFASMVR